MRRIWEQRGRGFAMAKIFAHLAFRAFLLNSGEKSLDTLE
jgi:hypothetical protein